jgi:hypothetical protein
MSPPIFDPAEYSKCAVAQNVATSLVTGEELGAMRYCISQRTHIDGACGPDAILWEAK